MKESGNFFAAGHLLFKKSKQIIKASNLKPSSPIIKFDLLIQIKKTYSNL